MATLTRPTFVDGSEKKITDRYLYVIWKFDKDEKPNKIWDYYLGEDGHGYYPESKEKPRFIWSNNYYFYLTKDNKKLDKPLDIIKEEECYGPIVVENKKEQQIVLVQENTFFGVCLSIIEFNYIDRKQKVSFATINRNLAKTVEVVNVLKGTTPPENDEYTQYTIKRKESENNDYVTYKLYQLVNSLLINKCIIGKGGTFMTPVDNCHIYKSCDSKNCLKYSNNFLCQAIGVRIKRDKTFKFKGIGAFAPEETKYNDELVETDKVCYMIFIFIKMKLSGTEGIWELKEDGSFEKIEDSDFKKKAYDDFLSDNSTNIIEGLQQYYILLEQMSSGNKGKFQIKEAYCDGDRIL